MKFRHTSMKVLCCVPIWNYNDNQQICISLDKSQMTVKPLTCMDKEVHPMNLYDLPIPAQNFPTLVFLMCIFSSFQSRMEKHGKFKSSRKKI